MTVYPVSSSDQYYLGYTGQKADDESGAQFQFALEEQASDTEEQTGPVSLWDYQGPTFSVSISSALWELDSKKEPETIEDKQKTLDAKSKALTEEFLKFSEMTPAEKIRAIVLGDLELTEEKLAALPPEERQAIEDMIKEAIERALGIDQIAGSSGTTDMVDGLQTK